MKLLRKEKQTVRLRQKSQKNTPKLKNISKTLENTLNDSAHKSWKRQTKIEAHLQITEIIYNPIKQTLSAHFMNTHGIHRADNIHRQIPLSVQLLQLTGKHTGTRKDTGNQHISVHEYSRIQLSNFTSHVKMSDLMIDPWKS